MKQQVEPNIHKEQETFVGKYKFFRKAAVAAVIAGPLTAAMATNGMILEGYGPISTGMGGASQAISHGTAAMAQNPATLSMMQNGSQLDVAFGLLGPNITASMSGQPSASSSGTSYTMPAIGYVRKDGQLVYGVGVYAIGGMGTEYGRNSFLAMGTGDGVRSELGVGSLIFPVSYQVNPLLAIGGSVDFVWATMDMKMAATATQMGNMMTGGNMTFPGGTQYARLDFSDGDQFSGAAKANGYRAKIGFTYKSSDTLVLGGSYQSTTSLSDMQTATGSASFTAYNAGLASLGSYAGKVTVQNFQWPSVISLGASWQASPSTLVAADIKSIGWAEVMKSFKMRFDTTGAYATFAIPQNWKDQTVLNLGVAYKANNELTLRAGVNVADSPIPDTYVNPMFPATIKTHYTLGLGYEFSKNSAFNLSYVMAPEVSTTNSDGVTTKHSQSNWQLMYSHRF